MTRVIITPEYTTTTEIPLLHSIWCVPAEGMSREEFEEVIRAFIERRGEDPDTATYNYGLKVYTGGVLHDPAVNVIWRASEPMNPMT